jgi:hypothetical protein
MRHRGRAALQRRVSGLESTGLQPRWSVSGSCSSNLKVWPPGSPLFSMTSSFNAGLYVQVHTHITVRSWNRPGQFSESAISISPRMPFAGPLAALISTIGPGVREKVVPEICARPGAS